MVEPTIVLNGVPVIKNEVIAPNTILIMYKHEGKSKEEIIQMKKDKNFNDMDKILYNIDNDNDADLFKKVADKI